MYTNTIITNILLFEILIIIMIIIFGNLIKEKLKDILIFIISMFFMFTLFISFFIPIKEYNILLEKDEYLILEGKYRLFIDSEKYGYNAIQDSIKYNDFKLNSDKYNVIYLKRDNNWKMELTNLSKIILKKGNE